MCSYKQTSSHIEYQDVFENYTEGTIMLSGTYIIKLEGNKDALKTVDWKDII